MMKILILTGDFRIMAISIIKTVSWKDRLYNFRFNLSETRNWPCILLFGSLSSNNWPPEDSFE